MKNILFFIVIIALVAVSMFAAGRDFGRDERSKELQKVIDASIIVKKKHKQKQIELPIQEYKARTVRAAEI